MKQYILSILCLLAAFVLPITAQNNGAGTKAAPDAPAMPYKLTLTTIGDNNGEVAVEDNADGGGVITGEDNTFFVYSASTGNNGTTVKLTVTPAKGYIVRTGYPKAYKTDNTGAKVTISGSSPYTFKMPNHPVTVEIAYANQITSVAAITLKEEVTAENVVSKLPGFVHFTLGSGRKDSIAVTGWTFSKRGKTGDDTTFDHTPGAVNRFSYTAATLPDSIVDNGNKLKALILVANMAEPLKPEGTDKEITISGGTGENLNSGTTAFNGTIEGATVKSLKVAADVTDATLTLSGVTVADGGTAGTTTINAGADLTLKIEGDNNLGTLKVESGATIVLNKSEGATLKETTIDNAGTFRDSTATVTKVTGAAALSISGGLSGDLEVAAGSPITLTATTTTAAGTITFTWQKKESGSYTNIPGATKTYTDGIATKATGVNDQYSVPSATTGDAAEYRCLIERTVPAQGGGGAAATTLLSTQPATVEVKSGGNPTPPPYIPVYYRVTLPTVEGFTTAPAAGLHVVEEGYSFSFALTREEGYTGDLPTVTTNRGETIAPRESDGKYIIRNVDSDITISFGSHPTANEAVEVGAIRIWNSPGGVNIHTPQAVATAIYTLSGHCVKQFTAPAGDSRIALPKGLYIVVAGQQQQKVIVH